MVTPEAGRHVRYREGDQAWEGTVIHVSLDGTVFLELDEPTPFMKLPDAIVPDLVVQDAVLDESYGLGSGIHEALTTAGVRIEPGVWEDFGNRVKYFYLFQEPQPIQPFIDFCKTKHHRDQKLCWLQAAVLGVVPIGRTRKGTWEE